MAAIKTIEEIQAKWVSVTPSRAPDYQAGVERPRKDWADQTFKAEAAWKDGVARASAKGAFGKGVKAAGTARWQEGALTKGVQRWGPGVVLGGDRYAAGFAPFREAIARVNLPPRFARRDPRNLLRVTAIVEALVKVKESQGG